MNNKIVTPKFNVGESRYAAWYETDVMIDSSKTSNLKRNIPEASQYPKTVSEMVVLTSYPPRECGIATYSRDLIAVLKKLFGTSFIINVCALESGTSTNKYPEEVKYILDTTNAEAFSRLANRINQNNQIQIVLIQHEFGFYRTQEKAFLQFLSEIKKKISIVFHTVLPHPSKSFIEKINLITTRCESVIVMTSRSMEILVNDYGVSPDKITIIAHGTHLVAHENHDLLKIKYALSGRKVLITFGLLSSGKSIETTLYALPEIIKTSPEVIFLIIGKTHPEVVKNEGEKYRDMLVKTVEKLRLKKHVRFINSYLSTPELLEYLQLTDIYLFTTNDPNQAVSGTFAYAMSCACPIISTPIPHAKEVLSEGTGIIFDFRNSKQLGAAVKKLLDDDNLRNRIGTNTLQKIISTAWENSGIAHARVLEKISGQKMIPHFILPPLNLNHLKKMTSEVGIIQFSKNNQPDLSTGYTLDDNARALIAMCMYLEQTDDNRDFTLIRTYLNFIQHCQLPSGRFENYLDDKLIFTKQNRETNLNDANGRAIWALGFLISKKTILPQELIAQATSMIQLSIPQIEDIHSTRSMAFIIKGLFFYNLTFKSDEAMHIIENLANRMVQMYKHESSEQWKWFESYLTYANSVLPEAMLYAWLVTGNKKYKNIAVTSFQFLLSKIFNDQGIQVISNKDWLQKGGELHQYGEQPIDVAYTIMTLDLFYDELYDEHYRVKMEMAFNWFLGKNRINQIVYNPCTGGCYDGLEEFNVNMNQGAESTVSYLLARLTVAKHNVEIEGVAIIE